MPTILNLGCGTRTNSMTVNIDFSIYQRLRARKGGHAVAKLLLRGERRAQFEAISDNIVVHDLRTGIPAEDNSVDAVYHSHTLEHFDGDDVPGFMAEILRVLKPGGMSWGASALVVGYRWSWARSVAARRVPAWIAMLTTIVVWLRSTPTASPGLAL
jgi:SAM-dependent methyltransferase